MIHAQNGKIATLFNGSLATNNTTTYAVAMSGYRSVRFLVQWDKPSATNSSTTLTTLTYSGGDSTSLGTAILTGTTSTSPTSSQLTIPINNLTANYTSHVCDIRNDKGYSHLGVLVAPSSTSFKLVNISAHLTEPTEGPIAGSGATGDDVTVV